MYRSITRNINRFGSRIVLVVKKDGAIDFDTGEYIQTETKTPMTGLIGHYTSSEIIDNVVNIDDLKCTIQTTARVLKGDSIEFEDSVYEIMNVRKLIKNDVLLKTTLQLRRSGEVQHAHINLNNWVDDNNSIWKDENNKVWGVA